MKRHDPRWRTRFGTFVSRHTVAALRRDLATAGHPTHVSTVYGWLRGDSLPRADRLLELLRISRGRLRVEDLLRHRQEVCGVADEHGARAMARRSDEGDRRD